LVLVACYRGRQVARLYPDNSELGRFAFAIEASLVAFMVAGTFLPGQYLEMVWHIIGLSIALDIQARTALTTFNFASTRASETDMAGPLVGGAAAYGALR